MIKIQCKFQEMEFNQEDVVEILHDRKNSLFPRKLIGRLWKEKDEFGNLEFIGYDVTERAVFKPFSVTPSTILAIIPTKELFISDELFMRLGESFDEVSATMKELDKQEWKLRGLMDIRGCIERDMDTERDRYFEKTDC